MLFNFDDGHGAQALDQNQLARRLQFSVATGCAVSPGTNDLTVQVSAGGVIFDGASVSVSAQDNVALASPDSADPRKDVVYVDGTGDVKVATGTPEPAQPPGQIRRDTFRPAPPDLAAMNAVVLAEVWVSAQASDIVADDISDRRLFADAAFRNVKSESVSTTTLTVDGDDGVGVPDTSTVMSLEFGSWTTADANRPVILKIEVESETDGVSDGVINVRVDENGDTTEDYKLFTFADSSVGNAFKEIDTFLLVLPAEGQFQIENVSDPNSNNNIRKVRKFTL